MTKRILSALLWFYAGWYFGAILAGVAGVSPLVGPVIGAATAALVAGDPRGLIWTSRRSATGAAGPAGHPGDASTVEAI